MSIAMSVTFHDVPALLARVAEEQGVPAVAAAGVVAGTVAHIATHGFRDRERQLPMTADTPSRWYSISKPLTGLALAQLVAQKKLRWDQPVAQLVPGVRFADPVATERATIADCLLHRTGLTSGDWTWFGAPSDPAELLRRLPHVPCRPGFRAGHYYQNLHFTILGEVFRTAGTDWHQALHDLLEPLGIKPLTRLREFIAAERALGYGPNGFTPATRAPDFDFEAVAPASAVCGSITELARLAAGVVAGNKMWRDALRPVLALGPSEWPELQQPCVALAGRTVVYRGELALQWAGGFRGYTSHLVALPGRKVAAAALATRTGSPAAEALAWSLLDRAAGWEALPWADRFRDQKQRMRQAGEKKLADRLAQPAAPWPVTDVAGRYQHPAYGELTVTAERRLRFREVEAPLVPRADGTVSADVAHDGGEIYWTLRPEVAGKEVVAWQFNPDDPAAPCRFVRQS
jgi:CubicO group peptidase (beta-lactamase class C family)